MNVLLCKLYNIFLSPRTNNFKGNVNIYGRGSLFSIFILQVQVLTFYFACTYSLINDICTLIESLSNPPPKKQSHGRSILKIVIHGRGGLFTINLQRPLALLLF